MQYSPKLKRVAAQILEILKAEKIAGVVVLHTIEGPATITKDRVHVSGFSEFLFHINTPYSAAAIENDRLKVKGKAVHYPSKEHRDIMMAGAVNMLSHLGEITTKMAMQAIDIENMVKAMVDSDDTTGNMTSHSQQNN